MCQLGTKMTTSLTHNGAGVRQGSGRSQSRSRPGIIDLHSQHQKHDAIVVYVRTFTIVLVYICLSLVTVTRGFVLIKISEVSGEAGGQTLATRRWLSWR